LGVAGNFIHVNVHEALTYIIKLLICIYFVNNRYCDEGMVEAVTTLMWAAPRLQSDVQELRVVNDSQIFSFVK